jgi:hypothetical protein
MPLSEKALLVTLSLSMFSPKKTDKRITRQVLADNHAAEGALRVAKRLLPDEAVEPVRKLHAEVREYHYRHTLPWGEDNERLIASAHYLEYTDWMRQRRVETDRAVDDFLLNYPAFIEEARRQLNGAFNASDYPSIGGIRGKFAFRLDFKPVPDAGDFRVSLMREEMDDLRGQLDTRVEEAERSAKQDLARRIAEPLAAMVNRLSEPDAVFRDSLVGNLREICDLIPALNVLSDPAIDAIRQNIQACLYNTDPELLRENATVRSSTARKAQAILDQMNDYFCVGNSSVG